MDQKSATIKSTKCSFKLEKDCANPEICSQISPIRVLITLKFRKQPLGCIPVTMSESSVALHSLEWEDYALKEGRVTESCEVLNICLSVCASETLDILTIPHEGPTEPRSETSVHSTSLQVKSEI